MTRSEPPPSRHDSPTVTIASSSGRPRPVCVLNSPLAAKFAGLATIQHELLMAREMVARARKEEDQLIVSALWRAAVGMYTRAFTGGGKGMPKLEEEDHLNGVSSDHLSLHASLISARNNFLSHAGASDLWKQSAQLVLTNPDEGMEIVALVATQTVRSAPPADELNQIEALFSSVIGNVMRATRAAHDRVLLEIGTSRIEELYARATVPTGLPECLPGNRTLQGEP